MKPELTIKVANQPHELEEVCRLNHQTFSEEIPQHEKTANGLLIDKFHSENQYIICQNESEIIGMIALRDNRPFSLDYKLENIDAYLPPYKSLCEIRLLTVKPKYRSSRVFYFLFSEAFNQIIKKNYDFVLISGILAQQKLYRSLGFVPFGPLVGDTVKFQPMYSSPDFYIKSRHNSLATNQFDKRLNVLPGPVDIKSIVAEEFTKNPGSHRSEIFVKQYREICMSLSNLVNTNHAQIFSGSATLANEVMIAHISSLSKKGLILSNGEFGNRIIHQAECQNLEFYEYKVELGKEFETGHIVQLLKSKNDIEWLYFVHCETSIGILNNLPEITKICNEMNILVFVDCVSTFGIVPLDLSCVYMASANSGKAIGSLSGLSVVFYNDLLKASKKTIPIYLDIRYYIQKNGIPFTLNSNALLAFGMAVNTADIVLNYQKVRERTELLREQLLELNLQIFESTSLHPAISTLKLPKTINSHLVGKKLEERNILVNYNSDYLVRHNSIQVCLFSDLAKGQIEYLVNSLKDCIESQKVNSN